MKRKQRNTIEWLNYFRSNAKARSIDWAIEPKISNEEKSMILPSLKAWQLGETSEGKNLIQAASDFSSKIGDPNYLETIKYFIKEEQKHGENLGLYLDAIGEKRIKFNLGDQLFRWVRGFNRSIEMWTITVIIIENYAQLFYKSLADATECKLLKSICKDILTDEAPHIRYQLDRLQTIIQHQSPIARLSRLCFYKVLFYAITYSIWIAHSKVFIAGNVSYSTYLRRAKFKYSKVEAVFMTLPSHKENSIPTFSTTTHATI